MYGVSHYDRIERRHAQNCRRFQGRLAADPTMTPERALQYQALSQRVGIDAALQLLTERQMAEDPAEAAKLRNLQAVADQLAHPLSVPVYRYEETAQRLTRLPASGAIQRLPYSEQGSVRAQRWRDLAFVGIAVGFCLTLLFLVASIALFGAQTNAFAARLWGGPLP